jgi:hypothetical protein
MKSYFEWTVENAEALADFEMPEGELIGSTGFVGGVKHIGPLPPGHYRIVNPVGGRANRLKQNKVMVVPSDQDDNAGHHGSFFYIDKNDLGKLGL